MASRPIVTVAAVDVACPLCGEFIAAPSGSLFFEINEYVAGDQYRCFACGIVVELPAVKTVLYRPSGSRSKGGR